MSSHLLSSVGSSFPLPFQCLFSGFSPIACEPQTITLLSINSLPRDCIGTVLSQLAHLTTTREECYRSLEALRGTCKKMKTMVDDREVIIRVIKTLSLKYGISQEEVGAELNTVGARKFLWESIVQKEEERLLYSILDSIAVRVICFAKMELIEANKAKNKMIVSHSVNIRQVAEEVKYVWVQRKSYLLTPFGSVSFNVDLCYRKFFKKNCLEAEEELSDLLYCLKLYQDRGVKLLASEVLLNNLANLLSNMKRRNEDALQRPIFNLRTGEMLIREIENEDPVEKQTFKKKGPKEIGKNITKRFSIIDNIIFGKCGLQNAEQLFYSGIRDIHSFGVKNGQLSSNALVKINQILKCRSCPFIHSYQDLVLERLIRTARELLLENLLARVKTTGKFYANSSPQISNEFPACSFHELSEALIEVLERIKGDWREATAYRNHRNAPIISRSNQYVFFVKKLIELDLLYAREDNVFAFLKWAFNITNLEAGAFLVEKNSAKRNIVLYINKAAIERVVSLLGLRLRQNVKKMILP